VRAARFALVAGGVGSGRVDVSVGKHRVWSVNLATCGRGMKGTCVSKPLVHRSGRLVVTVRSHGKRVRLQGIAVLR
jgi:hypothetical protein